jgi:hypothetical protein
MSFHLHFARHWFPILGIVAGFLFAASGQSLAAVEVPGSIKAELRVAATGIAGEHHTLWLRTGPERDPLEVPLNVRTFSAPIQYAGLPLAQFFATKDAARAAEPVEKPLLTTTLPQGSTLLVFVPGEGNYRILPVAAADFPYGSFRFANLTRALVRAELGKEASNLAPGESRTFSYTQDQPALGVRLYSKTAEKGARLLRQTNWSISMAQRELVLFYINPDSGLVQTRHLVDAHAPPQEAAAPPAVEAP